MPTKIVTIVQARTASTRLPNKVMLPLAGGTVLERIVERVKQARLAGTVVVATTDSAEDDVIAESCWLNKIHWYRGHPTDLLDRHYRAGRVFGADVVVKIPSDCPLIDPKVIDRVLKFYLEHEGEFDFVSNLHPPSYPDGNDVEVIPIEVLKTAHKEANKDFEREHATPFIWDNPERFRIGNITWEAGRDYSMRHRWVLDYEEDYQFISAVYNELYQRNPSFGIDDILRLIKTRPDIKASNEKYLGVNWYRHHLIDLKTVAHEQTRSVEVLNAQS